MILERDGRLLCSPRNPQKEAQDWLIRQKINSSDCRVLVLGFGAGYHVQELKNVFPNIRVDVLELDQRLQREGFHFVKNPKHGEYNAILPFRPAWAGLETEYLKFFLELTGRGESPEVFFQGNQDEMKIWYCLRELIK